MGLGVALKFVTKLADTMFVSDWTGLGAALKLVTSSFANGLVGLSPRIKNRLDLGRDRIVGLFWMFGIASGHGVGFSRSFLVGWAVVMPA